MNAPSFLETPNAVHRRKVFMHVLTPLSNSRKALEAVVLWGKHYGSQEMLLANIVEYCKLLCDKQTFDMNAEQLSQMLITGLFTWEQRTERPCLQIACVTGACRQFRKSTET